MSTALGIQTRRHPPLEQAQQRPWKRMPPVGLEMITSWKDPELTLRRRPLRVFPLPPHRRAPQLHPLVQRRLRHPHRTRQAAVAAIAAAAPSLPAVAAPRAGPLRPPHLRPTPRLAAAVADAHTKAILISRNS